MGRRRKRESAGGGGGSWLTTYGDLVTNLMCFWVLMYSMAVLDLQKFDEVAKSVRSAFSSAGSGGTFNINTSESMISITPYNNGEEILDELENEREKETAGAQDDEDGKPGAEVEDDTAAGDSERRQDNIKVAAANIQGLIDKMGLNENIKVIDEQTRIILRVDSVILFDTGSADLKSSAKPVIEKMGTVLKTLDTEILVQGHADDRPINTTLFPSNWELSTKRATNVVKFLVDKCDIEEKYLTPTGNAEFKPIAPNDNEYNRQKNRRIDIVILK